MATTILCPNCGRWINTPVDGTYAIRFHPPSDLEPYERVVIVKDDSLIHQCRVTRRPHDGHQR